jgi:hypothetical protein
VNGAELRAAADRATELLDAATPGSWSQTGAEVERNLEGWSRIIATCDEVGDAALIAAAPDLLAVLAPAARHLSDLLDAIGDPEWLGWWTGALADIPETLKMRLAKVADAAAAARREDR